MAGGLLNLIAIGNANVFLTGNPDKTYFRIAYSKYTNFGLQKFRIDYTGTRDLRLTEQSTFTFKMPRYAELLMDTYITLTIPDIWSPIYPRQLYNTTTAIDDTGTEGKHAPYEFRWIEDLGTHLIKEIEIVCGSFTLSKYSGEYLAAMVDRDFTAEKKLLFNKMSGNVIELNNPSSAYDRLNTYPNAVFLEDNDVTSDKSTITYPLTSTTVGVEPSIRGRNIYIPINSWFTLNSRCALPLVSMQYHELEIRITLRPIQELFQVRDVFDSANDFPYVQPDFNQDRFQMYRFLQSPLKTNITDPTAYSNKFNTWNADIHLISTYAFLSKEEAKIFAKEDQVYLIKDVFTYKFDNISGTKNVKLDSKGMVSSWMWYLQRNDVSLRNEWSNYTNWAYRRFPTNVRRCPAYFTFDTDGNTGLFTSGNFSVENQKDILISCGILLDGKYRENTMPRGVFDYVEKYTRTGGCAKEGIYCYNFCLDTSPLTYQPSGAINLGMFQKVELEMNTFAPQIDRDGSKFDIICDAVTGEAIAVNKQNWRLYEYTYNMVLFEERYNVLSFIGGSVGTLYAR